MSRAARSWAASRSACRDARRIRRTLVPEATGQLLQGSLHHLRTRRKAEVIMVPNRICPGSVIRRNAALRTRLRLPPRRRTVKL